MMRFAEFARQDIVYALRSMRKAPGFAITAILTLALGIGANTAIFTVVRAVLLNPLEYRDPDKLVYVTMADPQRNVAEEQFTLLRFDEMRQQARSFAAIGAYGANGEDATLAGEFEAEALKAARVSANFLDVLQVRPVVGRSFLPEEDIRGGRPVAMISAALWKRRFDSDPNIAGRSAVLDSISYTIVGVLPPSFHFPFANVDVWFTRPSEWSALPVRFQGVPLLKGFGRLKADMSLPQAQAEMDLLSNQYSAAHPGIDRGGIRVVLLKDRLVQNVRPMLQLLFGAVGFVLLIACANVASLLLARATSRSREFALRSALGAGRSRLVGQLLAESLLLALAGGGLGALLSKWCLTGIRGMEGLNATGYNPLYLPGTGEIQIDGIVLGFTLLVAVGTGVLFGLFPSLQLSRPDLAGMLRESGAGAGRGASGRRGSFGVSPRACLVIGQVAMTVVPLIGAALLMRSIVRLRSVNPGFEASRLLTMKIALPLARYDSASKRAAFFDELIQHVNALPGVREATVAKSLPTTAWIRTNINQVQGQSKPDERDAASYAVVQSVSPGYFQTLEIPLRRGRVFETKDNVAGAPPVIIVNEALARRIWPDYPQGIDPVGQHIGEAYGKTVGLMEVIGVVADIHEGGLASNAAAEFYVPNAIHPPQTAYLAVRTNGEPLNFVNAIRGEVTSIDHNQSVSDVRTMEAVLDQSLGNRRWTMLLLGAFAGVALLLSVVGIYGVIAYTVAQRVHELGVRRALGANESDILRLVLTQGLTLTIAGTVIGTAGALMLTRMMKGLLFEISPNDPATLGGIAALLLLIAAAASYIPARRAAKIDPTVALRA